MPWFELAMSFYAHSNVQPIRTKMEDAGDILGPLQSDILSLMCLLQSLVLTLTLSPHLRAHRKAYLIHSSQAGL